MTVWCEQAFDMSRLRGGGHRVQHYPDQGSFGFPALVDPRVVLVVVPLVAAVGLARVQLPGSGGGHAFLDEVASDVIRPVRGALVDVGQMHGLVGEQHAVVRRIALALRRDRMATIQRIVSGLTDQSLNEETTPVKAPGWPESRSYRVRDLLLHVLHEEWEHRIYVERDLDALQPHQ